MKYLKSILFVIFVEIFLIFLLFIYLSWNSLSLFSLSDTSVLWASVISTIVLVIINALYVWQNRQTVQEMEKARKTEFMPHLKAELFWLGPMYVVLKISNFGKGPAINIDAEIEFLPSNQKRKFKDSAFAPNETMRIFLPDGQIDNVCTSSANINVKGTYQDVFGQKYEINEKINVRETLDGVTNLMPIIESNEVAEAIKNLKTQVSSDIRNVDREISNSGKLLRDELRRELDQIRGILEKKEKAE